MEKVFFFLGEFCSYNGGFRCIYSIYFVLYGFVLFFFFYCIGFDFVFIIIFGWGLREGDTVTINIIDFDGVFWLVWYICYKNKD